MRYRKNGVLKRLKATPVRAIQFILAQLFSRLYIVLITAAIVYAGSNLILDFIMLGSYLDLLLVTALATLCMISFGLIFASRLKSEELADGLMNLATWPMMVFFRGILLHGRDSPGSAVDRPGLSPDPLHRGCPGNHA